MLNAETAAQPIENPPAEKTNDVKPTPPLPPAETPKLEVVKPNAKASPGTSVKTDQPIDPAKLRAYLETRKGPGIVGSPLAPYAELIANSEYAGLIIAICSKEQYNCTRAPNWNYWGFKAVGGGWMAFATAPEAITAAIAKFEGYEARWGSTLESWRGRYCVDTSQPGNVCPNWEPVVKKIKLEVENL